MGKAAHDDVLDALLEEINANVNLMCICSQQPTTRTEAAATYALATVALAGGDMVIADGAAGGRKLTIAAKSNVPITASGSGSHIVLVDNTKLYFITTNVTQTLASGNLVNIPTWTITAGDPT